MLSAKVSLDELGDDRSLVPTYANRGLSESVPRYELPEHSMDPDAAYQLIHDELSLDGNPTLNLATFVTTWMDERADQLMAENANKNAIDWDEYPQTVELQDRCVNMLARLFGSPEHHTSIGCATVGSSEAIHLGGLAMKWRWRAARQAAGKPDDQPNLVMGANVQVCWEKFARYFDVEPRYVPLTDERFVIGVDEAMALVDENTIGVVGILGSTYTGEYEPIAALSAALDERFAADGVDVPDPRRRGERRLRGPLPPARPGVGLPVAPGPLDQRVGAQVRAGVPGRGLGHLARRVRPSPRSSSSRSTTWAEATPTSASTSRAAPRRSWPSTTTSSGSGKSGYRQIMEALADTAKWIAGELAKRSDLTLLATGSDLPVVCFGLAGQPGFSVFDLSALLRQRGWIVPAYKMAPDAEDVEVLRVVVREGLSRDLASELVHDIGAAIDQLAAGQHPDQPPAPAATPTPAHRRGSARVAKPRSTTKTRAVC